MEVRTLLFVNTATLAIYAAGMFTLVLSYPKARGIRWFMYSSLVAALSSALLMSHGLLPRMLHLALGMAMLPVSIWFRHIGFCEFVRAGRRHWIASCLASTAFGVWAVWMTIVSANPDAVIKVQSFVLLLQVALNIEVLLRYGRPSDRTVRIFTSIVIAAAALTRLAWSFRHTLEAPAPAIASNPNSLWVLNTLFSAATTFCFVSIFVTQMEHDLREIAGTDALTGALNRRSLDIHAAREMTRCRRYGFPLSVVVMDLDHFKALNDTHGHNAGDSALCMVVQELQAALRGTDLLCRSGGEEFLILLPHTNHETGLAIAERLRKRIAQIAVPVEGKRVGITASLGVASWNGEAESWTTMVKRADAALYLAKSAGRNCVVTGENIPPKEEAATQLA